MSDHYLYESSDAHSDADYLPEYDFAKAGVFTLRCSNLNAPDLNLSARSNLKAPDLNLPARLRKLGTAGGRVAVDTTHWVFNGSSTRQDAHG